MHGRLARWREPHSPSQTWLHLRHSSFFNPSVASPTSQLILQIFRCFTSVTAHSLTLPSLHLRHSSFYNPSVASSSPQVLRLRHLESRPCWHVATARWYAHCWVMGTSITRHWNGRNQTQVPFTLALGPPSILPIKPKTSFWNCLLLR